jgi:hypothetical protein
MDLQVSNVFKRFCLTALLCFVLLFGAVWAWTIWEPMGYQGADYPLTLVKTESIQAGKTGSVIILGDSSAVADFLPNHIGAGVTNLALTGATPVEAYYLSRHILAGRAHPKAVIISIMPHRFIWKNIFWRNTVSFGTLNFDEVDEVRRVTRQMGENDLFGGPSPGDVDERLKILLYAMKFPACYFPSLFHAGLIMRYEPDLQVYKSVQASRGQMYYGKADGSQDLDEETLSTDSFRPSKVLDYYFRRTIELYRGEDIPVYFIEAPHNEASVSHYPRNWREDFSAYIKSYATSETNFHVLGDLMPVLPSNEFGDSAHLNPKWAPVYSDSVAKMLNDAAVPGGPFGAK